MTNKLNSDGGGDAAGGVDNGSGEKDVVVEIFLSQGNVQSRPISLQHIEI